jgi:hypothetical protein
MAKELPRISLDALELTLLIARKDPRRHPRVAARWLLRYLEEHSEATIERRDGCRMPGVGCTNSIGSYAESEPRHG